MSIQPPHDLLHVLHTTLCKIDADPEPSPSLMQLRHILVHRIEFMESAQRAMTPPCSPAKTQLATNGHS